MMELSGLEQQKKGLICYNDFTWTLYNSTNSPLPSDKIRDINIRSDNSKWIATTGGLVQIKDTIWTIFTSSNSGLPSNDINALDFEQDGTVWIATLNGLVQFDGINWTTYTSIPGIPYNHVYKIAVDKKGNKWLTNGHNGVVKYDDSNWKHYHYSNSPIPDNEIKYIAIDPDNRKWIATTTGIATYLDELVQIKDNDQNLVNLESMLLYQNYPNPFNPSTEIKLFIPKPSYVRLEIFNIIGQRIKILVNEKLPRGNYAVSWNGRDEFGNLISTGVYLYKISSDDLFITKKMIIIR